MQKWKENASKNETLAPHLDLQVVSIMGAHDAPNQAGYIATLTNFRTASPAMVEDSVKMLRRTAGGALDALLHEFHQMYLNWLKNAGRLEESGTVARYF